MLGIKNLRWNRPATPLRWVPPSGAIRAQRAAHYARLSYVPQALSGPKTGPGHASDPSLPGRGRLQVWLAADHPIIRMAAYTANHAV
ncbi:hypothetical protein LN572_01535, partial [Xanthomonas citri pv. fuscans]|nr:hypothetical protein [Xanthomonas citri pv. fuscans]